MHKKGDMYKMYMRTPTYVSANELPSSGVLLAEKNPEDGNLLAETYVGVLKYNLYMSLFLCICWSILDLQQEMFAPSPYCYFTCHKITSITHNSTHHNMK